MSSHVNARQDRVNLKINWRFKLNKMNKHYCDFVRQRDGIFVV
ncbi:Uncharacterised protein [Serratia grimesii]|nr:Uncharacterised protein [Serratia grimesii]CAI2474346.1 Uncharacterised protein [Serratia grimesii]SUI31650.1 Uncharacterised protein [Serratia grimesii]